MLVALAWLAFQGRTWAGWTIARFANLLIAAWLLVAPWLLDGMIGAAQASNVIAGAAVIVLSLPRGPIRDRYAGWDALIR